MEESKEFKVSLLQPASNGDSAIALLRLRLVVAHLLSELESIDSIRLAGAETRLKNCESISFYDEVRQFEIALIKGALCRTQGNQVQAAGLLGINPTTLNAKMKQYGLRPNIVIFSRTI